MKILSLLLALTLPCAASTRLLFTLSHTDGNVWQFTNADTQGAVPIGCCYQVGTNSPSYGGHTYSIDTASNTLKVDNNPIPVGILTWNGNTIDVGTHYGFCISHGQGYLASQYNDGDPTIYLFQLNLVTAEATFMGFVGPASPTFSVGGMVAEPY